MTTVYRFLMSTFTVIPISSLHQCIAKTPFQGCLPITNRFCQRCTKRDLYQPYSTVHTWLTQSIQHCMTRLKSWKTSSETTGIQSNLLTAVYSNSSIKSTKKGLQRLSKRRKRKWRWFYLFWEWHHLTSKRKSLHLLRNSFRYITSNSCSKLRAECPRILITRIASQNLSCRG